MTQNEKIALVAGLAGLSWYLYTREKGLTLTGQPANAMLVTRPGQSLVTPSYTTSTAGTNAGNAVAAFGALINKTLSIFTAKANANAPSSPSASSVINPNSPPGQITSSPGVPSIGSQPLVYDNTLSAAFPFWSWNDPTFFQVPDQSGRNQAGQLGTGLPAGSQLVIDGQLITV